MGGGGGGRIGDKSSKSFMKVQYHLTELSVVCVCQGVNIKMYAS